ncbi:olfactory receptor 11A1-like [Sphaeramia orbicularis]|uniref:olfactory receptor 11A1-like n=1 Tax=Sphaeramia orbicularis TaxID=375764 RepID=UPI00117F37C6|nr:olfactory receptor 11A1-like [Sphaeramia orbicularis]
MFNSTIVTHLTLGAYFDTGLLKYLFFLILMSLYVWIIISNVLLIVLICVNRSLHEPMYLFLCSLFVNELSGSTGLFPFLLLQILRDVHTVSTSLCFLQNFFLFSYGGVEYLSLAIMSYDRYLAICHPLQYHTLMTPNRMSMLIALTWLCPLFLCVIMVCLTRSLLLCGDIVHKVYCDNYSVVKLACSDTTINNIYGLIIVSFSVFGPVILILYSYVWILKVCFSGSKQTRHKAVSTCTPHLASLINFLFGGCFELLQSRFNMKSVPNVVRILLSLYWLTCQPLFNPLLYGLNLSKIRILCKSLLSAQTL